MAATDLFFEYVHLNSAPEERHLPPMLAGWQERLDHAATAHEVVEAARDFVATITPEETQQLPPECRPSKLVDAQDVSDFAFTLVRCSCADEWLSHPLLLRMATFFTRANQRLARITADLVVEPPSA